MPKVHPFRRSAIIYGDVVDSRGRRAGNHPLVVIEALPDPTRNFRYAVVLVTSNMARFDENKRHFKLPFRSDGHPVTKLNKENFANCEAVFSICHDEITRAAGYVPQAEFTLLIEMLNRK